jgi:DNA-binding NtrC family response regulator
MMFPGYSSPEASMASLAAITQPLSEKLLRLLCDTPLLPVRHVRALVVSSQLEVSKPLLQTLESLRIDTIVCGGLVQAEEVLSKQTVDVVFCDDYLPDGSYSDLVRPEHWGDRVPRVVVTTRTGDWDLYFDALGKGAFDVIQCPCYAKDVEMTIVRVLREEHESPLPQVGPSAA